LQVTLRFAHGLEKAVSQQQGTEQNFVFLFCSLLTATDSTPIWSCHESRKPIIDTCNYFPVTTDKCSVHAVNLLVDAVYSPYIPYLLDYPTLQQTFLVEQLQATRLVNFSVLPFSCVPS